MRAALLVLAATRVAGCSSVQPLIEVSPSLTTLPMPSGASEVASASGAAVDSCDASASLRPSTEAGPAEEAIRQRGRLIVGLDQSTNLFSFRDPVSGQLEGFDVDIAREMARDLVGDPSKVEFRLLTSPERITALENQTVDIVVNAMTITCARAEQIAFSTVYFEASQRLLVPKDSDSKGLPTWPASGFALRWTPRRWPPYPGSRRRQPCWPFRIGTTAWWPCSKGRRMRPAPTTRSWPDWLYRIRICTSSDQVWSRALRDRHQQGTGRPGSRSQCQPGTDPRRRDMAVALPEVAHGAGAGTWSTRTELSGLIWLETRERAPSW